MPHVQWEIPRFAVYCQVRSTLVNMQGTFYVLCLHAFKSLSVCFWYQMSAAYSSIGRICWLNILRRSIVGSAFPTALWTIVFEAIMARVDLSFTCLLFSSNRGPWFENMTARYLYLVHSSIRLSLKVKLLTVWVAKYFLSNIFIFVLMTLRSRCHLRQYFDSLSSNLCSPELVSDVSMRSSACSRWFIFRPPILTPARQQNKASYLQCAH